MKPFLEVYKYYITGPCHYQSLSLEKQVPTPLELNSYQVQIVILNLFFLDSTYKASITIQSELCNFH